MASTYLTRTLTNSNQRTFTFSCWVKRSGLGSTQYLLGVGGGGAYASAFYFDSNDKIEVWNYFNSSYAGRYRTNARYRDTNAWYHIVMAIDTTQSTDTDRFKLYVNGELITSYEVRNNTGQNQTWEYNSGSVHQIGRNDTGYFDGSMSHIHFVDGAQLTASSFGETDSTTGEWKIKTEVSVTYGTNGFFILKDGNSVTDQSGNSNNFTVAGGTLTNTEDCPSNVFCTINPLVPSDIASLGYGNTVLRQSDQASAIGTLGFQGGKYYWEVKNSNQQSYTQLVGVLRQARMASSGNDGYNVGTNDGSWGYFMQSNQDNGKSFHNNTLGSVYQTTSANDILQVAVDADAGKIWWGVNGTWVNSGDPANGTNAVYTNLPTDDVLFPAFSNYNAGQFQINFGNGYFGANAVSSAGTNASGIGIFEYDVPTGYTALSTKGLNE